jgi:hypothetical protein
MPHRRLNLPRGPVIAQNAFAMSLVEPTLNLRHLLEVVFG